MQQRKAYRQVPNLNILPLEYQRPPIPFRRILIRLLLAVVIAIEIFFIMNLYQEKFTLEAAINSTEQKIQQIEKSLAAVNAQKEEAKELEVTIEALKKEREALENDWSELGLEQGDWPQVMTTLFQPPDGVNLRSITRQSTGLVSATGTASNYTVLLEYRDLLLASPAISQITSLKSDTAGSSISFIIVAEIKMEEK